MRGVEEGRREGRKGKSGETVATELPGSGIQSYFRGRFPPFAEDHCYRLVRRGGGHEKGKDLVMSIVTFILVSA